MVTGGRDVVPDRGQLLLAGSVVLAVAVLGVAVLLNASMYAGAGMAGEHPAAATESAGQYESLVEADLHRLVNDTADEDALRANVTTYADRLARVAARSDGAVLDVRLVSTSPSAYAFEFSYVSPKLTYRTTLSIPRPDP